MSTKVIEGLFYAKSDEWVKVESGVATIGISDYAQDQLGDIVYLESIETGKILKQGEILTTVESVKAVSPRPFWPSDQQRATESISPSVVTPLFHTTSP